MKIHQKDNYCLDL